MPDEKERSARVAALNDTFGAVIACGSQVPNGTKGQYQFLPHPYSNIVWLATGHGFDSPYGDWVPGAGAPTGDKCVERYSIGRTGAGAGYGTAFGSLAVDPPAKFVTGLQGNCTTDRTA